MLGRTKEEHLLPQLLRLGDLTWPRLGRGNHLIRIGRNEELFAVERRLVLADTVDEAVAGGLEEKGAAAVGGEWPCAKTARRRGTPARRQRRRHCTAWSGGWPGRRSS